MAPMKAMKRRASSGGEGSGKRRKISKAKCESVSSAVNDLKSLPSVVRSLITSRVEDAFSTYKDDRHPYQVKIIGMVQESLSTIQTELQGAISEAEAKKASVESENATVLGANDAANAAAEAANKNAEDKKQALADSKAAVKSAKADLATAEANVKTGATQNATVVTSKDQLEAFFKNVLEPTKEGTIEPNQTKKGVTDFKQIGKSFSLEGNLVASVCTALSNKAAAWGTFDKIVMKDVEEQLTKILSELNAKIAAAEPAAQDLAAKVEAAKGAVAAAEAAETAATEADAAAKAAAKDAAEGAKTAAKAVKDVQPQINKASNSVDKAKAALEEFMSGAMAAFAELEAYSPPPPEPEPEAPAAAAAEEAAPVAAEA